LKIFISVFVVVAILSPIQLRSQHSIAREWNEVLLEAIRNDNARPTVHARNLFHISAATYDAWAAYEPMASTWLLGQTHREFFTPFDGVPIPADVKSAREEALSYATYRLIKHRFENSPGGPTILRSADRKMEELDYSTTVTSTDYSDGIPAHLGNYIAQSMIDFGLQDGSNEAEDYANLFYEPVNPPLVPTDPGNPILGNYNRWQPLALEEFIDQSGNVVPAGNLEFLSPEWGIVIPFSLKNVDLTIYERDTNEYWVYYDPGAPPYLQEDGEGYSDEYKWGFSMVSVWGSHLDPDDGVMWDISPASIGNIDEFPTTFEDFENFYEYLNGGDIGAGHPTNPRTGLPYETQMVPRGDYGRVLAEFWADGPDSETPPGHWYTILNYVNDNPLLEKRFKGEGPIINDLEWDIKSYFILGGAVHDAAISAWGIKGYYDYIRPISTIRAMADEGQSTDSTQANYSKIGIPLVQGYIESVVQGDPLSGQDNVNVGKIKLYTWKGHSSISDPLTDYAGVGWILAEEWWPYQRPTFVTPPFAGYISGHSTFSRAAAEVLTLLTGDAYFPGGMGEFNAPENEFLVFEDGPSMDVTLQWATYRDASDQCSLSRIWGGIHPPADDMPGRLIGEKIGVDAFRLAEKYFEGYVTSIGQGQNEIQSLIVYPNPIESDKIITLSINSVQESSRIELINYKGQKVWVTESNKVNFRLPAGILPGLYTLRHISSSGSKTAKIIVK
jgi:hypothetical protein